MTHKGILLWVPSGGSPHWRCVESYIGLESPNGFSLLPHKTPDALETTWNEAASDFLSSGLEWLFSLHDDIVPHPKTLMRLLSWDKPLVAALAFQRKPPCTPFVYGKWSDEKPGQATMEVLETWDWLVAHEETATDPPILIDPAPPDSLRPVAFTSTCCCLIHRKVLEAITPPWFVRDSPHKGGEDRRFFQLAAKAGFQAYVDRSNIVGHIPGPDQLVGPLDFMAWTAFVKIQNGEE